MKPQTLQLQTHWDEMLELRTAFTFFGPLWIPSSSKHLSFNQFGETLRAVAPFLSHFLCKLGGRGRGVWNDVPILSFWCAAFFAKENVCFPFATKTVSLNPPRTLRPLLSQPWYWCNLMFTSVYLSGIFFSGWFLQAQYLLQFFLLERWYNWPKSSSGCFFLL